MFSHTFEILLGCCVKALKAHIVFFCFSSSTASHLISGLFILPAGTSYPLGFYCASPGDQVFSSLRCLIKSGSGESAGNVSVLNLLVSCAVFVEEEHCLPGSSVWSEL